MSVEIYEQIFKENLVNDEDIYFKPFEKTFVFVMFSLVVGMTYPNPATEKWRILAIFIYVLLPMPATSFVVYDFIVAYHNGELDSIFRHTIVMGPFCALYLKMVLMFQCRTKAKEILEEVNRYFEKLNSSPLPHKRIAYRWLKKSIFLERGWSYCVLVGTFSFPANAICKNIYSYLFDEEPTKVMIHEMRSPYGPNTDFPFYECMFIDTLICSCIYFINFTGYDGMFVQLILHAAMRLAVCGESLKDAFSVKNAIMRRKAVREVVQEHIAICNLMDDINYMFRTWMSVITSAMVVHLCSCVYYISKGNGRDMEFMTATFVAVVYTFMVTSMGGFIQDQSEKVADIFYQSGWENVPDSYCKHLLLFMLARAQKSFQVETVSNMAVNNELFVAICKMAYSLFTFIQQT